MVSGEISPRNLIDEELEVSEFLDLHGNFLNGEGNGEITDIGVVSSLVKLSIDEELVIPGEAGIGEDHMTLGSVNGEDPIELPLGGLDESANALHRVVVEK